MEVVVINEDNLKDEEVEIFESKSRALLTQGNYVLVANYAEVCLLPGGKIDEGEDEYMAIERELKEETGKYYDSSKLYPLLKIVYYQKNYPTRKGEIKNRKIETYFFTGNYQGVDLENTKITEDEKKGQIEMVLMSIEELEERIKTTSSNPRNIYFNREIAEVLEYIKKPKQIQKTI